MLETFKDSAPTLAGWSLSAVALVTLTVAVRGLVVSPSAAGGRRLVTFVPLLLGASAMGVVGAWALWLRYRPQPRPLQRQVSLGIDYQRSPRSVPRPFVVHVATVDLALPGLRWVASPAVSGCVPARLTTRFLEDVGARLAFNTHYFRSCDETLTASAVQPGSPVAPVGFSVVERKTVVSRVWLGSTLYVSGDGRASLRRRPADVLHAISGRYRLLERGHPTGLEDDVIAPRVGIGLDERESTLVVVVVDGRQPGYSEGVTLPELSALLREYGAFDAIELDGGGSATLVARRPDGSAELLNSPIHGRIPGRQRAVASHLGIVAPASSKPPTASSEPLR